MKRLTMISMVVMAMLALTVWAEEYAYATATASAEASTDASGDCWAYCTSACEEKKLSDEECYDLCEAKCEPQPAEPAEPLPAEPAPMACEENCRMAYDECLKSGADPVACKQEKYAGCMESCRQPVAIRPVRGVKPLPAEPVKPMPPCPVSPETTCDMRCAHSYYACVEKAKSVKDDERALAHCGEGVAGCLDYCRPEAIIVPEPLVPEVVDCEMKCKVMGGECLSVGRDREACAQVTVECIKAHCEASSVMPMPVVEKRDCAMLCADIEADAQAAGLVDADVEAKVTSCLSGCEQRQAAAAAVEAQVATEAKPVGFWGRFLTVLGFKN